MHALLEWGTAHGCLGLFVVLALGVILPLPEDSTLLFAGYLISRGQFAPGPTWLAAIGGSVTGITISFAIGHFGGSVFLSRLERHFGITHRQIDRLAEWFHRVGKWGLVLGCFAPGVRHLMALAAGTARMRYSIFILFAGSGAVVWSSLYLILGFYLGGRWRSFDAGFKEHRLAIVVAAVVVLAAGFLWEGWSRRRAKARVGASAG
jgi:membrane protein DedA with SNARE-associated domain